MTTQLRKLAERIPEDFIGKSGKGMDAADHTVIRQLLLLYLGPHDWEVEQPIYTDMPDYETNSGKTYPGGQMVTGCIGRLTATIDGQRVTVREPGSCDLAQMKDGDGERLKHAASDALKRCAMSLGLGLHIWAQNMYFLDKSLDKREADGLQPDPAEDVGGGQDVPEKKEGDGHDLDHVSSRGVNEPPAPTDHTPEPEDDGARRRRYFAILGDLATDNVDNPGHAGDWKDLAHTIVKRQYQVDSYHDIPRDDLDTFLGYLDSGEKGVCDRFVKKVNDEWAALQAAKKADDNSDDKVASIREEMRKRFGPGDAA